MTLVADRMHQLKHCDHCKKTKPPEGGIQIGAKWNCQRCWINRLTNKHLKQYATPQTA